MSEEGADVQVEVAGQKVNLRNVKSLNTLATVATLFATLLIGYAFLEHKAEAKDHGSALVSVMREMAVNQRVTNCLMATPQDQRENKLPICERIAR